VGGVVLEGLSWAAAGGAFPSGVMKAVVPGAVAFDSQDQLFVTGADGKRHPLVRARTPNGKPWLPLDGFNLTVGANFGSLSDVLVHGSCYEPTTPGARTTAAAHPTVRRHRRLGSVLRRRAYRCSTISRAASRRSPLPTRLPSVRLNAAQAVCFGAFASVSYPDIAVSCPGIPMTPPHAACNGDWQPDFVAASASVRVSSAVVRSCCVVR
jgi:hypothetical protein